MKKGLCILICICLVSSVKKSYKEIEKLAWTKLYDLEIEEAYPYFLELYEFKKTDKNVLGLAHTQAILNKGNYYTTLKENIKNTTYLYNYGFLVAGFKVYYEGNRENNSEFSMEEFKAFHEGGKFKARKGNKIIIGEYENLTPKGVWEFYDLKGNLLRKMDSKTLFNKYN